MPNIQDIIQNWKLGVWSFLIIAAAIVVFWGFMVLFNQQHRMKPPKARTIMGGCGLLGFLFCWFFLTELARVGGEINDMHNAAVQRENRGLSADILFAGPTAVMGTNVGTNIYTSKIQGMSSGPTTTSVLNGADVLFVLHIANAGAPTTAWGFRADIIPPSGEKMPAMIPSLTIPDGGQVPLIPTATGGYRTEPDNYLLDSLSFTPLQTGAANNYWLLIHINGITKIESGTVIIITFQDVYGRTVTIQDKWIPGA